MRANAKVSATAFALAMFCASAWWGAFTTMTMLHDDAKFVGALSVTLDKPAVRAKLADWLGAALEHGASLSGRDAKDNPLVG